jgi:hypothetical protein
MPQFDVTICHRFYEGWGKETHGMINSYVIIISSLKGRENLRDLGVDS